ncbi:MAG TPA: tetratricopeptide repeat protein [Gemmataceae bacterium]|nr:tetratricopeptide repeat protein [Gemmataceae bacterium]
MFNVTQAAGVATQRGIAFARQGRFEEARMQFQHVLELQPEDADAHFNLANLYVFQNQFTDAIAQCQETLKRRPDHVEAQYNLAFAFHSLGRREEAIQWYRQVLEVRPDHVDAQNSLGLALMEQSHWEEAAACFRQVLDFEPEHVEALNNLGLVLLKLARWDEAVSLLRQVIRLRPHHLDAQNNLGVALTEMGYFDEAMLCFDQAVRLDPGFAQAHNNMGKAYSLYDQPEEAIQRFQQALRLNPNFTEAYCNLGTVHKHRCEYDEAAAFYEQAFRLEPEHPAVRWSRSLLWLLLGDFDRGWPEYEWRWARPGFIRRDFPKPYWDGSMLRGRTILLHSEQGLGDTIQFIRYVPLVKAQGGRVIVECQPPLAKLLANAKGIDEIFPQGAQLPSFDVHAELLSLPGLLRTTLKNVPADVPYLKADADLVALWRKRLKDVPGFKVGIAWQGSREFQYDRQRSMSLSFFAALAKVEGVQLISLQKGRGAEQLSELDGQFKVLDLGDRLDEEHGPFMDTAAIMMNLDLVISSDTSVPHLAGALGVPVWVALSMLPDWRWLLDREDCPWYPTMRLFRQKSPRAWAEVFAHMDSPPPLAKFLHLNCGDWTEVFARMATELTKLTPRGAK